MSRTPSGRRAWSASVLALGLAACAEPHPSAAPASHSSAAAGPIAAPSTTADKAIELPGLHNVVAYTDRLLSGAQPEGDEGFASLAALGIKTVLSVDGATPEVELARQHGLRYVHLPIGYDGVPEERSVAIAQALTRLPGPVYVHCHHGKHRSAAALGTAAVAAGLLTPEQAAARMKVSGTSKDYVGLWSSVADCQELDAAALHADPASFPEITRVSGLVATMTQVDLTFDNLKVLGKSAWQPAASHPDLVPARETKRLLELVQGLRDDAATAQESQAHPAGFQDLLATMITTAEKLDAAVRSGDVERANAQFEVAGVTCKQCHVQYRDR